MLFPDNTSVIAFACFFRASVLDRLLLRVLLQFVEFVYVCFSFRSTHCLEPCSNGRGGTVCPCSCAGGCVFCPLFCVQPSLFFFAHYFDPCFCHFNDCFKRTKIYIFFHIHIYIDIDIYIYIYPFSTLAVSFLRSLLSELRQTSQATRKLAGVAPEHLSPCFSSHAVSFQQSC